MNSIDFFSKEFNVWFSLSFYDFYLILKKKNLLNESNEFELNFKNNFVMKKEENLKNKEFFSGKFVECKLKADFNIEINNENEILISNFNVNDENLTKEIWGIGKIITFDIENDFFLVEFDEQIFLIDSVKNLRPISNFNNNNNNNKFILKCIKNFNENNHEIIKNIINENNNFINAEFNEINNCLILIGENEKIKEILNKIELKTKENEEKMKESELEKINKKKYKKELNFYLIFKEIIENEIKNLNKDKKENEIINYSIFKDTENEKNFKLILYSNNQNELENFFNKINYTQEIIINESLINVTETKNLINKAKVKFNKVGKHKIFLLGNEKSIKSFKTLWNLTSNYSKQIHDTTKEKENLQKEISSFKKQFNIK